MDTQLDLSIASTIKDPDLRASAERLALALQSAPLAEPSPPSSAKIIQFPLFPEATRPVANDMARSALFSCVQGKDRRFIKDVLLATVADREIRFTGEQLNQDDHDLLMQMVFMAQHKPLGPGSWYRPMASCKLSDARSAASNTANCVPILPGWQQRW